MLRNGLIKLRDLSAHPRGALRRHGIFDKTDTLDLDPHAVAYLEKRRWLHGRPYPARRARENQITRLQRHRTAEMGNLIEDVENHMPSVGVLPGFAVDRTCQLEPLRVAELVGGDDPGTDRCMGIERLSQNPLRSVQLPVAYGDVVADAKAEYSTS